MKYLKEEFDLKTGINNFKKWYNHRDIYAICKQFGIKNWSVNPDGTIDVNGNVDLSNKELKEIPLKFGNVSGLFNCNWNNLTNLIGSPKRVEHFSCSGNKLTSLEGCPEYIGETFYCHYNPNLWSFDHFPRHAKKVFLDTPILPIFNLFETEYLADGGEFFSTSWSLMEFFWDMDPVYPDRVIIKWRMNKFLESIGKKLSEVDKKIPPGRKAPYPSSFDEKNIGESYISYLKRFGWIIK